MRWRWKRYALAFVAAALAGLAARVYGPSVAEELFRREAFRFVLFAPGMLLSALVATVVGYIFPKGFFLWGFAVVLLHPLAEARQTQRANEWGAFGPSGIGGSELVGLILVYVAILSLFAVAFTGAAAIGAVSGCCGGGCTGNRSAQGSA